MHTSEAAMLQSAHLNIDYHKGTQRASFAQPSPIDTAVACLEAWLDTMRGPGLSSGYGGPVAHWWRQSLVYTGAGLDWRYEGIIAGYLHLWQRTGDQRWLKKACRAGDDLVAGQLANGHYSASAFEINPATAGTPHEAACDTGLLRLALALRSAGQAGWQQYAQTAEHNLRAFYLALLWDAEAGSFRDAPNVPSLVPNKAAIVCEALFLLAELTGDSAWVERYALPTLDRIVAHQVHTPGKLNGAIAQNSFGKQIIAKYFPIYIARCVPALIQGYKWSKQERYLDSALRAMRFIAAWIAEDGSLPTVVYPNLQVNRYPSWIAPLGDVLRAGDEARPYGFATDFGIIEQRLLAGQDASGGIQTAYGFAAQAGGRLSKAPDVRDVLHVAGWCDKAFRYLATHCGSQLPVATSKPFLADCTLQGKSLRYMETSESIEVSDTRELRYQWHKGETWARVAKPEFWLS